MNNNCVLRDLYISEKKAKRTLIISQKIKAAEAALNNGLSFFSLQDGWFLGIEKDHNEGYVSIKFQPRFWEPETKTIKVGYPPIRILEDRFLRNHMREQWLWRENHNYDHNRSYIPVMERYVPGMEHPGLWQTREVCYEELKKINRAETLIINLSGKPGREEYATYIVLTPIKG